jgi:hypothetical protein
MSAIQRTLDLANLHGRRSEAELGSSRATSRCTDAPERRGSEKPALKSVDRRYFAVGAVVFGKAQSCGVPVVAYDTGGLADAVEHDRTGLLVDAFSVENLASAVAALLGDDEKRQSFGSAARARAEALWSPSVIAEEYLAVYAQAIDPTTSGSTVLRGASVTPSKASI